MPIRRPFNLKQWITENRDLLKPPVGNKNLYADAGDYIVMIVGGPNARKDFHFNETSETSEIFLNGENVEYVIRDLVIAEKVSDIAAIREVREFAVAQQQKLGAKKGIVMDGRDIGTVVFPKAELKIFMTADNAVRVERRFKELFEKNPNVTIEEVKNNLEMRDYIDSNREISPLRQADDAIVLDNTNITTEQQLQKALQWVAEKTKG